METYIEVELNKKVLKQLGYEIQEKTCEHIKHGNLEYNFIYKDKK